MNCSFDSSQLIKEDHKLAPSPRLAASPEIVDMSWSFFWPSHSGFIKKLLIIEKLPNSSQQPALDQWPVLFRRWALQIFFHLSCNCIPFPMPVALQCAYLLDPNLFVRRCLHPTDWSDLTTSISQHSPGVAARTRPHMLHIHNHQHCSVFVVQAAAGRRPKLWHLSY